MKILFFGDSITDANRTRNFTGRPDMLGYGYVNQIAGELLVGDPQKYEIINRGNSGNRIVDLYARVKEDVINHSPDVLSILIGVNDVWHEIEEKRGVELDRFERVYDMLLLDVKDKLPDVKIILCEPFVLKGGATAERYDDFLQVKEYAKVVKNVAKKHGLPFVPLQDEFDEATKDCPVKYYLADGIHPNVAGAKLIANEWIKTFRNIEK